MVPTLPVGGRCGMTRFLPRAASSDGNWEQSHPVVPFPLNEEKVPIDTPAM